MYLNHYKFVYLFVFLNLLFLSCFNFYRDLFLIKWLFWLRCLFLFFISIIFIELLIKYWYPIYNQFCFILCYNEKDEGVSL